MEKEGEEAEEDEEKEAEKEVIEVAGKGVITAFCSDECVFEA